MKEINNFTVKTTEETLLQTHDKETSEGIKCNGGTFSMDIYTPKEEE